MERGPDDDISIELLPEDENQQISRRKMLRRLTGVVAVGSVLSGVVGCTVAANTPLAALYPNLAGQFGSLLDLGGKGQFPAATPDTCKLNAAGVFYHAPAKAFIVHLAKDTPYLLTGSALAYQLSLETFIRDKDDSYWLALYQCCVHLGTTVKFYNQCGSFKCPSHGAHYHCDGEYLDGPAPRSMDRFLLSFRADHIVVDTGTLLHAPHPEATTRLLRQPGPCLPDGEDQNSFSD